MSVVRAPRWQDIDTPEDLEALAERLRQAPTTAPATAAVLARITEARAAVPPTR